MDSEYDRPIANSSSGEQKSDTRCSQCVTLKTHTRNTLSSRIILYEEAGKARSDFHDSYMKCSIFSGTARWVGGENREIPPPPPPDHCRAKRDGGALIKRYDNRREVLPENRERWRRARSGQIGSISEQYSSTTTTAVESGGGGLTLSGGWAGVSVSRAGSES